MMNQVLAFALCEKTCNTFAFYDNQHVAVGKSLQMVGET